MRNRLLPAALLLFAALPACAQNTPRAQTQTYVLAYTLRTCDLRAQSFVQSVKTLKDADDDGTAGAMVAHLSRQASSLRRRQATAYTQVAWLLDQMNAPPSLRYWAAQTAKSLAGPLVYADDAKSLAKTEPDTAATLAELGEVQTIKAQAEARQPSLNAWLKLTGGSLSVWTAEVGSYAADLHAAGRTVTRASISPSVARRLLTIAPPEAPSEVRGDLSELVPRGGGNLQDLATVAPANVSPEKMAQVSDKLTGAYDAHRLIAALDKAE